MDIHRIFPTLFGISIDSNRNRNDSIIEKCLQIETTTKTGSTKWVSKDTYNTLDSHDITKDKDFAPINDFVIKSVKEYCEVIKVDFNKIVGTQGWFNIYRKGDYQEYHSHNPYLLSAIYYLKTPKEGSKLHLGNPFDDMIAPNYTEHNTDNAMSMVIQPEDGMFIIFRSHLQHCVEKHMDDEPRISLAYNFSYSA